MVGGVLAATLSSDHVPTLGAATWFIDSLTCSTATIWALAPGASSPNEQSATW